MQKEPVEQNAAEHQLLIWKKQFDKYAMVARDQDGLRVQNMIQSLTIGRRGPIVMSDPSFLKLISNMANKNVPARVIAKKGIGAYGYFEVTKDITDICGADIFSTVGQKTDVFVRFSTGGSNIEMPDGIRGVYGGAIKHYTRDGNWDLLGNQIPVYRFRDPFLFISSVHCQMNPVSGLENNTGKWDFRLNRPESAHQIIRQYSGYGIPSSYRTMNIYPISVFKMVNTAGDFKFVRFTLHHQQQELWKAKKYLTDDESAEKQLENRDFLSIDLYNAIGTGEFPSWKLFIQVLDPGQVENYCEKYKWDPFDPTKIWPKKDFPLREVGRYVLNRNVTNHFNETEQSIFNVANLVSGIDGAYEDRLLQGRMFAYRDAQSYRVGPNASQLPVNHPKGLEYKLRTYMRDGPMNSDTTQGGAPNYFPNSFSGPEVKPILQPKPETFSGVIERYDNGNDDNFTQACDYYESLTAEEKVETACNISRSIVETNKAMQERVIKFWRNVSEKLSDDILLTLRQLESVRKPNNSYED